MHGLKNALFLVFSKAYPDLVEELSVLLSNIYNYSTFCHGTVYHGTLVVNCSLPTSSA